MGTQSHCPVVSLPTFAELLSSIDSPSSGVRPLSPGPPSDPSSGATSHIRTIGQGLRKGRNNSRGQGDSSRHATAIGMLPDNVLLITFCFYRKDHDYIIYNLWKWHPLVHICRRWRQIVFESPHHLNLQILCRSGTPVRKNLGIWPAFPIVIHYSYSGSRRTPNEEDDIIAALEHPDRVCVVTLHEMGRQLGKLATVMQEPFPLLRHLELISEDGDAPVLPAEFLGGSAPRLQEILLDGIPFPALPALLLSASDLVCLRLGRIPPTGYISPEAMVAGLVALPRLRTFDVEFQSATSRPDRIRPPPVTRSVLPALTYFQFNGASEYLEDLVTRIDSPQLDRILIDYLNQRVDYQVAQLSEFILRSVGPKITLFRHARVIFSSNQVSFNMYRHTNHLSPPATIIVRCEGIDWQVSHIAQVLSEFSTTLSGVVHLKLEVWPEGRLLKGTYNVEWLRLLHQFSTVQTLYVSQELAGHIALALEDITPGEMVAEVFPSLDLICLVDEPASSIEKFAAGRRFSGRPVTFVGTEAGFDERLASYASE